MKTIRGTKVYMMMLALMLVTTSCVQTTSSSKKNNSTTAATSNSTTTGEDEEVTGTTTTTGDGTITYYDEEDEDEEELPGVAYSECGTLYKQMNNDNYFFRDSAGDTLIVQEYSYESASVLNQVQVNNDSYADAYSACVNGYISSGVVYLNTATLSSQTNNPSKIHKGNYTYEYCGYMAHTTYSSNNFTLIRVSGIDRRVKNQTGGSFPATVPTVGTLISSENAIEACVYSNKALYKDTETTFYRTIDTLAIDLGALN